MRANVASPSEPPPIARNKAGQVVGSEAASRLAKMRVERCKQTGEKYRTRTDSLLYAGPYATKRLRKLLRNIIEEILSVPVEVGDGQTIDIIDELRKKAAMTVCQIETSQEAREWINTLARFTVSPPKAEEKNKVVGNPDLDIALNPEEREEVGRRARTIDG